MRRAWTNGCQSIDAETWKDDGLTEGWTCHGVRSAFFSRSEGRAALSGLMCPFILGGPADRLHRPRRPGRAPRKQKGLAGSWARKAHARLVLLCQGCTLPTSVQLQKRRRHDCDWVQGVGRRDFWAVTRVQAGKQERELLLHACMPGARVAAS